jgi:hypothetical protein
MVLPSEWNELSQKQLIALANIKHNEKEPVEQLIKALHVLSGMGTIKFMLLPKDVIVNASEQARWVFEENTLTSQLIPMWGNCYGPESHFDNLQMHEFNHAEMAYQELVSTQEPEYLDRLVAILYRQGKDGYDHERNADADHRIPFKYGDITWHMGIVTRWPENVKHAILLWYDGCRMELIKAYPKIFKQSGGNDQNLYEGLFSLMHSVAGEKYGTFDEVENSYVHKILMALNIMLDEIEQQKKNVS